MYGIECTVPTVEPGHMVYGVRTWLSCFVRSPEIRGTFISFSIRVQFSVSVPFFYPGTFNFVILIGQHAKIHHPETSAIGCCASLFFILFIIISYSPDGQNGQQRALARFGAFACQERGGRRLINEQLTCLALCPLFVIAR